MLKIAKTKTIKLITLLMVLLAGGAFLFVARPQAIALRPAIPLPTSQSISPALSQPTKDTPTNAQTKPKVQNKTTGSSIVRFTTPADQTSFQAENNLASSDLIHLNELDAYRVNRSSTDLKLTAGVTRYENIHYRALTTPNDSNYSSQWYAPKVSWPQTWDLTTGSSQMTVAVIDNGFALAHDDFSNRWATNSNESGATASEGLAPNCTSRSLALDKSCNNLDDDGNGLKDDWQGWDFYDSDNTPQAGVGNPNSSVVSHGSLVAGLIGATGNNTTGIAGANWNTKLLPLQALDDNGDGYTDSVASAVHYAADRGAKVINLSLGADNEDALLKSEIDRAIGMGVTVVAAAGNSNCNCLVYPANYPSVIAVGATDSNDYRAGWSSYGANLDLVAPGTEICSTGWSQAYPTNFISCGHAGTSFSAPIVAGTVSLMLARAPSLTATDVERLLASTSTSATSFSIYTGYGRLNAYQAVSASSLGSPSGLLINKHIAFLGNASSIPLGPLMNSNCITLPSASCEIRLTGPSNQVVSLGTKPADENGVASFYWNASTLGLATGNWRVDAIASYNGQTTTQTDYLTVNP